METSQEHLQKHNDWAHRALRVMRTMPADAQEKLMLHVFRVVSAQMSGDETAAEELCRDLASTIRLHSDDRYVSATQDAPPPDRGSSVSLEHALDKLSTLR
jgi:hypothetical protein